MKINTFALAILASASFVFGATTTAPPATEAVPVAAAPARPAAATPATPPVTNAAVAAPATTKSKNVLPKAIKTGVKKAKDKHLPKALHGKKAASPDAAAIADLRKQRERILNRIKMNSFLAVKDPKLDAAIETDFKEFDKVQEQILALQAKTQSADSKKLDEISGRPGLKHGKIARQLLKQMQVSKKAPAAAAKPARPVAQAPAVAAK